jgi:hypothetical protein
MAFLDWIKQRKESAEIRALARKYGHDSIGTVGSAFRHYEKLMKLRNEAGGKPKPSDPKARPRPSWER